MVDCSPSSHEITVLLPNCLKITQHCQQYADACHRRCDVKVKAKATTWFQLEGLVLMIIHAKHQCYIVNTSEDMNQVKV